MDTRFPRIASQESLDRLAALDRKKKDARRQRRARNFLGWSSLLIGQVVLILLAASGHHSWPF